jgi:diguanylate cyclase
MTRLRGDLPRRAWRHIYRVTAGITAASVALSIILTNVFMEAFSAGINLQGLAVSIIMPIALGGPLTLFLMIKHEQLRNANVQLEHLATTDWLTACLNRGAFTHAVTSLLHRPGSDSAGGALLIIDADDFKSVNDRFGHHNGDEAIRLIAASIRGAVRTEDLVCRLGGEEFGVFLANTDPHLADQVAQRIRRAVSAIQFAPDGHSCPLSISIGGATYSSRADFGDLYRLADNHLYHAKNAGRDRVAMMQAA